MTIRAERGIREADILVMLVERKTIADKLKEKKSS